MNPYSITLHALGETLSHAQVIFGYAVIWIVSLVFLAFVASFAWFTLKNNQYQRDLKRPQGVKS